METSSAIVGNIRNCYNNWKSIFKAIGMDAKVIQKHFRKLQAETRRIRDQKTMPSICICLPVWFSMIVWWTESHPLDPAVAVSSTTSLFPLLQANSSGIKKLNYHYPADIIIIILLVFLLPFHLLSVVKLCSLPRSLTRRCDSGNHCVCCVVKGPLFYLWPIVVVPSSTNSLSFLLYFIQPPSSSQTTYLTLLKLPSESYKTHLF